MHFTMFIRTMFVTHSLTWKVTKLILQKVNQELNQEVFLWSNVKALHVASSRRLRLEHRLVNVNTCCQYGHRY